MEPHQARVLRPEAQGGRGRLGPGARGPHRQVRGGLAAGEVVDGGGQHHVAQLRLVKLVGQADQGLILGLKRQRSPGFESR